MEPIENNSQHEMQREYIDISVLSSEEMQYITYVVRMIIDPLRSCCMQFARRELLYSVLTHKGIEKWTNGLRSD